MQTYERLSVLSNFLSNINASIRYARENLVMFNIFIKDPYAKRFQKDEKITKTSYIANSGGLLGLCMGFSLISAAEILFHCFFGIVSAIFPPAKAQQKAKNSNEANSEGRGTVGAMSGRWQSPFTPGGGKIRHCRTHCEVKDHCNLKLV